ncbi:uncharacterized protein WM294_001650 isoform 2-T3 [Sarcoramphus papa]
MGALMICDISFPASPSPEDASLQGRNKTFSSHPPLPTMMNLAPGVDIQPSGKLANATRTKKTHPLARCAEPVALTLPQKQ